jgi:hypothetical protein
MVMVLNLVPATPADDNEPESRYNGYLPPLYMYLGWSSILIFSDYSLFLLLHHGWYFHISVPIDRFLGI